MHHLSSPEQTRAYLGEIIKRIRRQGVRPLTLPVLMAGLASDSGNSPTSIVLVLNAIARFTELDDETEELRLQATYERHSDETLARMVWHALLQGACSQHPASS